MSISYTPAATSGLGMSRDWSVSNGRCSVSAVSATCPGLKFPVDMWRIFVMATPGDWHPSWSTIASTWCRWAS